MVSSTPSYKLIISHVLSALHLNNNQCPLEHLAKIAMEKMTFGLGVVALLTLTFCPIGLLADGTDQYYEGPPDKSVETFQKWFADFNSWASF